MTTFYVLHRQNLPSRFCGVNTVGLTVMFRGESEAAAQEYVARLREQARKTYRGSGEPTRYPEVRIVSDAHLEDDLERTGRQMRTAAEREGWPAIDGGWAARAVAAVRAGANVVQCQVE